MQTFLPYSDFIKTARCLDYKRLGKQRVEAKRILEINIVRTRGGLQCNICDRTFPDISGSYCSCYLDGAWATRIDKIDNVTIPWENHPVVLMWRGYEQALALYGLVICSEWRERGYNDSLYPFFSHYLFPDDHVPRKTDLFGDYPPSIFGVYTFYAMHRDFVEEMIKYPSWLGDDKLHSSHRAALLYKDFEHYSQCNWLEEPIINYYWPTRKERKNEYTR